MCRKGYNYLFLAKWFLFLILTAVGLYSQQEYLWLALENDPYASPAILLVAGLFALIGTYRAVEFSRNINWLHDSDYENEQSCRLKKEEPLKGIEYYFHQKISLLDYLSTLPVILGITGTVLGLIRIGMEVREQMKDVSNAEQTISVFMNFMDGAMVAFYSTGTGMVFTMVLGFFMVFLRNAVSQQIIDYNNEVMY